MFEGDALQRPERLLRRSPCSLHRHQVIIQPPFLPMRAGREDGDAYDRASGLQLLPQRIDRLQQLRPAPNIRVGIEHLLPLDMGDGVEPGDWLAVREPVPESTQAQTRETFL